MPRTYEADSPVFEITTDPDSFNDVVKALEEGYTFEAPRSRWCPRTHIVMTSGGRCPQHVEASGYAGG